MKRRLADIARDTFQSFDSRNFRLFFFGQGISQVGNWLTLIAQTLLVLKLTDDGVAIGVLTACQFGPVLLIGAWTGLIADRSDKRRLLIAVQIVAMAQSFALAALAFMGSPPVLAIYAVALVGGITIAFDNPARRAFVVEMVPDDHVHNAVSLNSALMTSSRVIGPALAGLLITTVGYGWAFAVDGLSYVAVILAYLRMHTADLRPPPVTPRAKHQVRDGLRYVRRTPELFVPLVMMAVVGTLTFNFQVVFPLLVTRTFHGSEATFTILFSVISVGSLAGALLTARRRSIGVEHVVVASAMFGLSMLLFAVTPGIELAYPLGMVVGASSIAFLTASTAIVQVKATPEMRGRVLALQAIVFLGSTPLGGPILGWISDTWGPRAGVLLGGAAACGAALWGFAASRRLRAAGDAEHADAAGVPLPEPV